MMWMSEYDVLLKKKKDGEERMEDAKPARADLFSICNTRDEYSHDGVVVVLMKHCGTTIKYMKFLLI